MPTSHGLMCGECGAREASYLGACRECARSEFVMAVFRGDAPGWNADNECTLCGEHMAEPHHPKCEIELRGEGA